MLNMKLGVFALLSFCLTSATALADQMTGDELKELYSEDVTECGAYPDGDSFVPYCELWSTDGSITGKSTTDYHGQYRILLTKGEVCVRFGTNVESCGPYERLGSKEFEITFSNGTRGVVSIVSGDTQNLQ